MSYQERERYIRGENGGESGKRESDAGESQSTLTSCMILNH